MARSKETEEVLHNLFSLEEDSAGPVPAEELLARPEVPREALKDAVALGLVQEENGRLRLTDRGRREATVLVRRHRLAERLLHDVLRVPDRAVESAACEFEHFLAVEVTESICTLLGHPRVCPHGKPIPPGACCDRQRRDLAPVVEDLSNLSAGDSGTVAYIHTSNPHRLDRLASFGLLPGSVVRVHQTWPSLVLALGETQLALDRETARDIFVRRTAPPQDGGRPLSNRGRRRRRHRGGAGR